jgi:hypothetical protein
MSGHRFMRRRFITRRALVTAYWSSDIGSERRSFKCFMIPIAGCENGLAGSNLAQQEGKNAERCQVDDRQTEYFQAASAVRVEANL